MNWLVVAAYSLTVLMIFGFGTGYGRAEEKLEIAGPAAAAKISAEALEEHKVLVSVLDSGGNPLHGLKPQDFVLKKGRKQARIKSVEQLTKERDFGLNIVLVIDNSFSMKEREAVEPLLSALDEFLKIVKPLDSVYVVTFDDRRRVTAGNERVNVNAFSSKDMSDVQEYVRESFDKRLCGSTFLYEGIFTGLTILRHIPDKGNKFLFVFSDGEDLNSRLTKEHIENLAGDLGNLSVYAVDYMPVPNVDPFLKGLSERYGGHVWKASSAGELLPAFRALSRMLTERYVISYEFPKPVYGTMAVEPAELELEAYTMLDGSPLSSSVFFETGKSDLSKKYILFDSGEKAHKFEESSVKTAIDRYRQVLNLAGRLLDRNPGATIRIVGCNSGQGVEEDDLDLSRRRAERVRSYLRHIWGIDPSRMKTDARNLPVQHAGGDIPGGRAENQRAEILFDDSGLEAAMAEEFIVPVNCAEIRVKPEITAEYGIENWTLALFSDKEVIRAYKGCGDLKPEFTFAVAELGKAKISSLGKLYSYLKVTDNAGEIREISIEGCRLKVSKKPVIDELLEPPGGSLLFRPEKVIIEEVLSIESSPLLNAVYFSAGRSEIPNRYFPFGDEEAASAFEESELKGTMEKHYHILNVIGKRLTAHPEAGMTITGCNSDAEMESGNLDLSRARAESVLRYLNKIWGIDVKRMRIETRNLPAVPSTGVVPDGRIENQRVEIHSDSTYILDPVSSVFTETVARARRIDVVPEICAGYGVAEWRLDLTGGNQVLGSLKGTGDLAPKYSFEVRDLGLKKTALPPALTAKMTVKDEKGQFCEAASAPCPVEFKKRVGQKTRRVGKKVIEKYALILFDFNSAEIKGRNMAVVRSILERARKVPAAKVSVCGHTDSIGDEQYNLALSERRARAVYDLITESGMINPDRIAWQGYGKTDPPYDNRLPEGRALNRTVAVYLEYEEDGGGFLPSEL
ncbi:MAG: OmpA family protein [Pseudomonadota bacterium]